MVADRLDAIGELFELRRAQRGEESDWAVDTWAAVGAEVAAAFRVSLAMAGSFMRYALAMRERLPQVAEVFRAGDISYRLFQTIVYRTDLITDAAVLAAVDAELAMRAARWPSMTRGRLAGQVDKIVGKADVDAVRRRDQSRPSAGSGSRISRAACPKSTAACSVPTPTRWIGGWMRWRPRCVSTTRAARISGAPTRLGCLPPARIGWAAAAGAPTARPESDLAQRRSSFT